MYYYFRKLGLGMISKGFFLLNIVLITAFYSSAQVTVNPGGGSYGTVSAAFAAINAGAHTGAITIEISFNTNEPAAPTVLAASGVGSANYSSITIYPTASGVVVQGTSNASRAILEFNGADNITINGNLNNGSGTTRDLTIQNNTANTNVHSVLWFQSSATSPQLGCNNIVVKNTKIIGNADVSQTRTASTPFQPAVAFSSTTFPTSTTTVSALNNSNITFDNNEILRSYGGLHFGQTTTNALTGLVVTNNVIGSQTLADYTIFRAIYVANCTGALIQGNTIQNIRSIISSSSGAIELSGTLGANNIVRKNLIRGVSNTSTSGWASAGIYVISGNNNTTIDNNVIYDLKGANYASVTTSFHTYGIRLTAGTGHKVWYNSVNLYGTIDQGTASSTSAAIAITSTVVTGLDIRNNIFNNLHVSTASGFQAFCIRFASGYPFTTAGNTINNNYYGVPSSNTATTSYFVGGTYATGVTYATVTALQAATGYDAQSQPFVGNTPAPFTANNNLIIPAGTTTGIESGGVVISALGIPNTDFNNVNRPAGTGTAPDMGAYEFNGLPATGCTGTPSSGGTASASSASICAGNSATLSASGYTVDIGIEYNWQSSSNVGGPFTDIGGATTPSSYASGSLTADTYYRLRVTCTNSSLSIYSNVVTITVNNPQLLSTTPGSRCGTGTVTLGATASTGIVNWYAAASGGTPIGTGTSFTTPIISSTTTYYASASSGGSTFNTSKLAPESSSTGTVLTTYGQDFTLTQAITLNSVQVFSTTGTSITISLYSSGGTTQLQTTGPVAVTAGTSPNITIGWAIPPGTYRLCANGMTGNFIRDNTGVTYPFALAGGIGTMNGFVSSITGSVTTSSSYYFMYNWSVTTGCESSPRTPVTATVTTAPTINASANQNTVCNGGAVNLTVNSSNDPNYNYTWTSSPAGFNASGNSVTANPTVSTTYTVTANDPGTLCQAVQTVNVIALPATVTANATPEAICAASGTSSLSISPASGYGSATFQWFDSPNGSAYSSIGGATSSTYGTPTLTAPTYYKIEIRDPANNLCASPVKLVNVGIPSLTSTTPGSRCGYGSVNLQATANGLNTVNWYANASGGTPLFSGNSFNTPNINATTTYYAAATAGGTSNINVASPTIGTSTFITTTVGWGLRFTVNTACNINTVTVRAQGSTAGPASIQIKVTDLSDVTLYTGTLYNFNVTTALADYVVPVNISSIPPGNYKMQMTYTGLSNMVRESSGVTFPYNSPGGEVSITAGANGTGTAQTTSAYYWFYNWVIATGCEGPRTAVIATVNPSTPITAAATATAICPGGSADISVSSANDPNYTYTWTSSPAGYNNTGAGPHTVSPSVTTKYYVLALDNGTNCTAIDSVTIINGGTLTAGTVTSAQSELCISGSTTLTLTGASGGANQWQRSFVSASGPWTNVGTGANTYNTGTITQTAYYRVETSCNSSAVQSNVVTITVNNPQVVSTAPATRCGTGTVTLGATGSTGTTLKWYTASTGGTSIGTGTSFTTPTISTTTNYYVSASSGGGGLQYVGKAAPTTTMTNVSTYYMNFTVLAPLTIQSVNCYFSGAVGSNYTLNIRDASTLASVFTVSGTTTVNGTTTPQTLTLNAVLPPGNYQMGWTTDPGTHRESTGSSYPYTIPGVISITGNSFNDLNYWYYFYNWAIVTGCESARTMVPATVTPAPAINLVAGDLGLCTGGSTTLSVSSPNDPNYAYTWTSNPAGFSQTGNGPHTISPSVTTKYYVNAVDGGTGCVNSDSVNIVVTGTLVAGTVSASQTTYCLSGTPTITLTGSQGAIQWQSSTVSASGPWTNVGTGLTTYSPTLTQTTYIRANVSCQSSSVQSNVVTINVNNPQVLSTAPATRCGAGTVTLGATPSAGTSINWYAASSGGSPIGTGNTFTTPVIGSTTTYYAAAASGGGTTQISNHGNPTVTTSTQNTGLLFDLNVDVTLNSIQVYSTAAGTVTVSLLNSSLVTLFTSSPQPIVASNLTTPQTVTLGWAIPAGTNYRILVSNTGNALGYHTGSFPIPLGNGVGQVTSGATATGTTTLNYFVYNMNTTVGCESGRTAVAATVTSSPAINASATFLTPCAGNPTELSVTSSNPGYTYSWTSTPSGFTGTGAGPLTATPSVATTYQVLATDNSGGAFNGCGALATVTVTPTANPLTVSATSTPTSVCPGQNAQLNTNVSVGGYTMNTNCGISFIDISSTGTPVTGIGDDTEHNITFPSFTFNGVSYTTGRVGTNGALAFGSTTGDVPVTNAALPTTTITAGNIFLAPYWVIWILIWVEIFTLKRLVIIL
jgi:hypothetical protein